ncbi:homoserine dehydrogenase [Clostridium estertheticum]|uniref:Homoserine dehydrogenase n=2 Tax=Clostridium estertheticum TaxID=238834 RepID=A0A1J0GEW0_9CLOT|nr:homoserine dehydrogenase [Clostridium estertheticum]APC39807.1 homoserine dehydrogenase [Clostridium estertheticum subsp. estertheticum]MBU3075811.1 homoserine dehydrogenase [Clostridium estertheticum]MBU3165701.1 homoserine dehydrogenase [Clostridium estertheticum]MBU3172029.1 homoserine dehydrogenase [Clostridium estertheticum]MBZ9614143.1 homoserine dehydrogenase [Clostridium estertheticum subsp. laramiense]
MEKVKIAILGFGNVGTGVWKILQENRKEIMKRSNYDIEVAKILVSDINKKREIELPKGVLTNNIDDIINDDSIKIVVELIGGRGQAKEYMIRAMKAKKHIVTANKLVVANWGEELFKIAEEENVLFYYEASVAGGIPIIREINESLTANRIEQIIGIINGTTNYILSKMTNDGISFDEALKEAQDKGYAEADPTSDVDGFDAVYKLAIMASLAFGTKVDHDCIYREGIRNISAVDIEYAQKFGYTIKLLAIAKEENNKLELRVHPTLIPSNHPMANVNDVFNAILIKGNAVGELMLYGKGAGDLPTGSAVVGDIISILRNNVKPSDLKAISGEEDFKEVKNSDENESEFYIRLNVKDRAGVLGDTAKIFGKNNVSITSLTQDVVHKEYVLLAFITHKSSERNIRESLKKIKELENVNEIESIIRIESFN